MISGITYFSYNHDMGGKGAASSVGVTIGGEVL
jgi:hypothetical protein